MTWCCEKVGRGCTTTTMTERFDCEADVEDWRHAWPVAKANWCCEKVGRGCSTSKNATTPWYRSWSSSMVDWCCQKVGVGCTNNSAASDSKSVGPLLVQYYEPCMQQGKKDLSKRGLTQQGGKCRLARSCFKQVSLAESACKVIYLPTVDISELKNYVCGESLCIQRVREVVEQCNFFPALKTRFAIVYHLNNKYCPTGDSPTDLINDYSTCMNIKGENATKCQKAESCYKEMVGAKSSCDLNDGDAGPTKSSVCNSKCQAHVSQALAACVPYQPVVKAMLSVVWHQAHYSCASASNTKMLEIINFTADPTDFAVDVAQHNRLADEYNGCGVAENSTNRAECEEAKRCYHYLSVAETSCNVVSLPNIGVSEVKPHICGDSTCGTYAKRIKDECADYPSVMAAMDPVLSYQLKYCPDGANATDLFNDHSLCRANLKPGQPAFCEGVATCYTHLLGVNDECSVEAETVAAVRSSVCSDACRTHVRSLETACSNYAMANESRASVALYEAVLGCTPPNASQLFLQSPGALAVSLGFAGSCLLVGAVTGGLVTALIMLRGVSRLSLRGGAARDSYAGYEPVLLHEEANFLTVADEHSS